MLGRTYLPNAPDDGEDEESGDEERKDLLSEALNVFDNDDEVKHHHEKVDRSNPHVCPPAKRRVVNICRYAHLEQEEVE